MIFYCVYYFRLLPELVKVLRSSPLLPFVVVTWGWDLIWCISQEWRGCSVCVCVCVCVCMCVCLRERKREREREREGVNEWCILMRMVGCGNIHHITPHCLLMASSYYQHSCISLVVCLVVFVCVCAHITRSQVQSVPPLIIDYTQYNQVISNRALVLLTVHDPWPLLKHTFASQSDV